jgi:hypothetical protein
VNAVRRHGAAHHLSVGIDVDHHAAEVWQVVEQLVPDISGYVMALETPEGKAFGQAGDNGFIVPGDRPMRLTVIGKEHRRSLVLILHETGTPASGSDTKWVPKGLCRD